MALLSAIQARILAYAEAIGWTVVSRQEASNGFTKHAVFSPSGANAVVHR